MKTKLTPSTKTPSKEAIIQALYAFVSQRAGLEYANYGDLVSYRAEQRAITKDLHHARQLIRNMELASTITAADLLAAAKSAFSGRLEIVAKEDEQGSVFAAVRYCTGQYFPTEYRKAVCAVCASALWSYVRAHCMPAVKYTQHGSAESPPMRTEATYAGLSAGDWLRRYFKRQFGRGVQSRWFD